MSNEDDEFQSADEDEESPPQNVHDEAHSSVDSGVAIKDATGTSLGLISTEPIQTQAHTPAQIPTAAQPTLETPGANITGDQSSGISEGTTKFVPSEQLSSTDAEGKEIDDEDEFHEAADEQNEGNEGNDPEKPRSIFSRGLHKMSKRMGSMLGSDRTVTERLIMTDHHYYQTWCAGKAAVTLHPGPAARPLGPRCPRGLRHRT